MPLDGIGDVCGWHGNLLMVRNALMHEVHQLISPGFEPRDALVTYMLIDGLPLRVVNADPGLLPGLRAARARVLLDKLGSLEARPISPMGVLNEWRGKNVSLITLGEQFTTGQSRPSFPCDTRCWHSTG